MRASIQIVLQLLIAHLIAVLEATVIFSIFLHRIVGQMDELVIRVVGVDAELGAARSEVAFLKEIDRALIVDKDPHSDVELPLVYQQRALYVFLYYKAVVLELVLLLDVSFPGCSSFLLSR